MTQQQQTEQKKNDEKPETTNILRRNNRGCKSEDFYNWPEQPFDDMDSPLAVQQYIQQLIHRDPSDVDEILRLPEGQDLGAWKIEHLRLFCMQLNRLATRLQECCKPETCNQMTATEQWIFLCAAHKQPNECPAIDYTRHTLDQAASLLNSNKYFPSRVTIKESSVAKLGSVCRRVYRIFSHAYYHHFQVFDDFERESHLCKRFSKFVTIYELMSKDSLIVPSDGSKPEVEPGATQQQPSAAAVPSSTVTAPTRTDLIDDIKQEAEQKPEEVTATTQVKYESKVKKLNNEEVGSNQNPALTMTWTPSAASTNTILKGSSALSSSTKQNQEDGEAKVHDPTAATVTPNQSVSTTRSAPKNGVESEA